MNEFISSIEAADTIAVTGHIHPDGDCIGSCLGLRSTFWIIIPGNLLQFILSPLLRSFSFFPGLIQ